MLEIAPLFYFPAKIFGYLKFLSYIYPVNDEKIKVMIILQILIILCLLNLILNWEYRWVLWIIFGIMLFMYWPTMGYVICGGMLMGFGYRMLTS